MGGTAYAAVVITGTNVKDGSLRSVDIADGLNGVQGRDVRDGSLGAGDLSAAARASLKGNAGATGAAGPAGASGATGTAGGTGPRGFSAWDVIPSGTTVTGYFERDLHIPANDTATFGYEISLPGLAPVPLTNTTVNFAPDTDAATSEEDATCQGSPTNPTAPAGKVCLYVGTTQSDTGVGSLRGFTTNIGGLVARQAFQIVWNDSGASADVYVDATWAYTAP